ncbi:MAG: flagellar hook basal-body protein [Candidatus Eisenbacteria sp.]|nr:flagellar hook basal-body protein [Candidatus Eisenbacteria bacterium]
MGDGIYLAGAAMLSQQIRQEAMVHNLANASTPGYKAARLFAKALEDVEGSVEAMRDAERGQEVYIDFSQGSVQRTGRELDFALDGDGFFVVDTPEGERFARDGSFSLDIDGRLVNHAGFPVLTDMGPVVLDDESSPGPVNVNEDGEIFMGDRLMGKLMIRHFVSLEDLQRTAPGLFGPGPGRHLQESEPSAKVRQGCLEESNALAMDEMIRMISEFKKYEASHKMVQMQDGALRQAINDLISR